jgi:glucokinase
MSNGYPRLLGDVGGTNARWAWQAGPGEAPTGVGSYPCARFPSLQAVIEHHLQARGLPIPAALAFGIANPVDGDEVRMTNHHWSFSIAALQRALGVARCRVINDFEAIARALPVLAAPDLRRIGAGTAVAGAPMAVLGAGTGLGVASTVRDAQGRWIALAGEGGHVSLPAADAREAAVVEHLRLRYGHASAERAVSGPGLTNLHEAVCALDALPGTPLHPAEIISRALARTDPACVEALRLFASFLGSVAGNLALTLGAHGGVFIGGGIVPRLGAVLDTLPFRERFEAKGRFRAYLAGVPTSVIVSEAAALLGAAQALDELDG